MGTPTATVRPGRPPTAAVPATPPRTTPVRGHAEATASPQADSKRTNNADNKAAIQRPRTPERPRARPPPPDIPPTRTTGTPAPPVTPAPTRAPIPPRVQASRRPGAQASAYSHPTHPTRTPHDPRATTHEPHAQGPHSPRTAAQGTRISRRKGDPEGPGQAPREAPGEADRKGDRKGDGKGRGGGRCLPLGIDEESGVVITAREQFKQFPYRYRHQDITRSTLWPHEPHRSPTREAVRRRLR